MEAIMQMLVCQQELTLELRKTVEDIQSKMVKIVDSMTVAGESTVAASPAVPNSNKKGVMEDVEVIKLFTDKNEFNKQR